MDIVGYFPGDVVMQAAPARSVVAGDGPDWQLIRNGNVLVLSRHAAATIEATVLSEQDTPGGRLLTLQGPGSSIMTVLYTTGLCRDIALGDTTRFVFIRLADGTLLRGCAPSR